MTLHVDNISKHFRDGDREISVLRDLSFELAAGESLSVTGPSGSGKSTLLNLLAGLIEVDRGDIHLALGGKPFAYAGADERARTAMRRANIGYIYQFFNLVPTLTVFENVTLPLHLNRRRGLETRAGELLDAVGLLDRQYDYPRVLSGGEQQRVAVARALVMQPPLLLADEPTGNLDAGNSEEVSSLLYNSCRDAGIALVIATHSTRVAGQADRQLLLDRHASA